MTGDPAQTLAERLIGSSHALLDTEQRHVLAKIEERRPLSRDAADVADETATWANRLSDRVAAVGGSWRFIIGFSVVLFGWMLLNSDVLSHWGLAFDPYPYIFLNLMLSTLAAVQAPIIMMSQNRQASKDRLAASLDYEVNLRTELEMLRLHEKIDMLVADKLDEVLAAVRDVPAATR
ncbi:DUF1003 domain-containing protein [Sphingomonas sp.]|uniref:DUF1003 domain-containing protein n=1 Tax=Sphingomonas sp. TaxID=28214 RepID=UPI003AFFFF06